MSPPDRVSARTPVRVADAGGWTDTWFARHGAVCAVAVGPAVEVTVDAVDGPAGRIELGVAAFGDRYAFALDAPPGRHPLLEATLARWAPRDRALVVETASRVPPGSGLGTSASVVVALVAALDPTTDAATIARRAHEVETVELGWQSGVQDQLAAAYGGALHIEIDEYPSSRTTQLALAPATWDALAAQLVTVYVGRPHHASAVHTEVIASLGERRGADPLEPLRRAAHDAARALTAGDLAAYGDALTQATEGKRALHASLVNADADAVWSIARRHGALGWKVNGAGGEGGTVTVIAPDDARGVRDALAAAQRGWTVLDLTPDRDGLTVTGGTR